MRYRTLCSITAAGLVAAPATASAMFAHTVARGESLYSIAAADGLSVSQLAAANGLSPGAGIGAGKTLYIPPQSGSYAAPATRSVALAPATAGIGARSYAPAGGVGAGGGGYVVQPGDTLWGIAARSGVSVAQLAGANGLEPNGLLRSGRILRVSGSAAPVSTSTGGTGSAEAQPVGAAAQGSSTTGPYTTSERVSPSVVGQIAAANGVPPSLAKAIGYQESGFNNGAVSSAGARGVMQILPGTWDWIQRTLDAGSPLSSASATSNVRGGVLLLHSLLRSTGGDPALAAASYYQGLSSVRAHGMYPSTQNYVNNVLALARRFGG